MQRNPEPEDIGLCPYCLRYGAHRAGCPNDEPESTALYTCAICGEDIAIGERYFDLDGKQHHRDCFEDTYLQTAQPSI